MILLISTLKVVLFSRKLSNFHWLLSLPVTDFLYRNEFSSLPCSSLLWSLCHSNIFINMTVIIPPMTKHARLCQNCLPKYIFLLVSRDDAQEFRQEKRSRITNTQCRCLQSCSLVRFSAAYVKGCFWLAEKYGLSHNNTPIPEQYGSGSKGAGLLFSSFLLDPVYMEWGTPV